MSFKISPTVMRAYQQDPQWFENNCREFTFNGHGLGVLPIFDVHGYDAWGYDCWGRDRAGHTAANYAESPMHLVEDDCCFQLYEETIEKFSLASILESAEPLEVSHDLTQFPPIKFSEVELKYNAKFTALLPLKNPVTNAWYDAPVAIFYQDTPPVPGYSNYFGVFVRNGQAYITSGASGVDGVISGIKSADGEIIYSACRHDYRTSADGTVWIDGGRDYTRSSGNVFSMVIKNGKFYKE